MKNLQLLAVAIYAISVAELYSWLYYAKIESKTTAILQSMVCGMGAMPLDVAFAIDLCHASTPWQHIMSMHIHI